LNKEITALLVIDPYNDFISEKGKIWNRLKAVADRLDRSSKASTIASVSTQRSGIVLRSSSNISRQLSAGGLGAKDRGPIPRTTGPASEQFERDEQHEYSWA
jgi:hypothetical protein